MAIRSEILAYKKHNFLSRYLYQKRSFSWKWAF